MLPVVVALKNHPDRERLVPKELWKYFDEHLLVSGWYPERDYFVLIEALVKTIDPGAVGGDVWRYFAKFSVKNDIEGAPTEATAEAHNKGIYRRFAAVGASDPASVFLRANKLWSQYHDTGRMEVHGGRVEKNSVVSRLLGFHIPIEGFVRLQGYYLEEFGRVVGVGLESKVTRSTAKGDPFCEWEFTLERTPSTLAYVASLPALPAPGDGRAVRSGR